MALWPVLWMAVSFQLALLSRIHAGLYAGLCVPAGGPFILVKHLELCLCRPQAINTCVLACLVDNIDH